MSTMRGAFFICLTILVSVFGITFYGYQQDQFLMSSANSYVAIFDKKSRTMNICDKGNCILVAPRFPSLDSFPVPTGEGSFLPRIFGSQEGKREGGQRLLGTFPQPQQAPPVNPQMMGGNPQMMQQQMPPQMNPQMMRQQMSPQMNPQMMQQQMPPQMNPQMMQQMQQRGMAPQQMGNSQMMGQPQMARKTPQAENASGETDDSAKADDAAPDEADEETAPV